MKWGLICFCFLLLGCKTSVPVNKERPICSGSYHELIVKEMRYQVVCQIDDTTGNKVLRDSQEPFLLVDIETQRDTQNLVLMLIEEKVPEIVREMEILGRSFYSIQIESNGQIHEVKTLRTVLPYTYNYMENLLTQISMEYRVLDPKYFDHTFYVMVNLKSW